MASSSSKTKSSGLVLHSLSPSTRFCSYTTSKTSFSSHAIPSLCNSILHPQFSFWSQPRWNSESKSSTHILSNLCTSFLLFSHGSCYLPASRASQGLRFVCFSVWCNPWHLVHAHNTLLRTSISFQFRFFFVFNLLQPATSTSRSQPSLCGIAHPCQSMQPHPCGMRKIYFFFRSKHFFFRFEFLCFKSELFSHAHSHLSFNRSWFLQPSWLCFVFIVVLVFIVVGGYKG